MHLKLLIALSIALAGCSSAPSDLANAAPTPTLPDESPPLHESHELASGIDQRWTFTVTSDAGTGHVRFVLFGPGGGPFRADQACLEHSFRPLGADADTAEGRSGVCGTANLSLAPEADLDGEALFERAGGDLLPGSYSFHLSGSPQAASVQVDFEPR